MTNIPHNRTIRPSSRLNTSTRYKIDTKKVSSDDTLIVTIDHESKPFRKTYHFKGSDVAQKNNIHFEVNEDCSPINITWSGAQPI